MLFDTHAHYDDERFDEDRDALLASMPENNVGLILNPGCDAETSRRQSATQTVIRLFMLRSACIRRISRMDGRRHWMKSAHSRRASLVFVPSERSVWIITGRRKSVRAHGSRLFSLVRWSWRAS